MAEFDFEAALDLADAKEEDMRALFNAVDTNQSGSVEYDELLVMLEKMGLRDHDGFCERQFNLADADGDKLISFPEFISYHNGLLEYQHQKKENEKKMIKCAAKGKTEKVQELLQAGASVDAVNK